jgi:hypothetical protein
MNIDIVCHHCGAVLQEESRHYPKSGELYVAPCSDCMDSADKRGYDRGFDEGASKGYDDGHEAGVASVRDDVKEMMRVVKEESSCAVLKDGATAPLSS